MRSDPRNYELLMPQNLNAALTIMAEQKRGVLPIAGGTDLMVQFAAGTLPARTLLSLWNLPELRRIDAFPEELQIGAACTYTDLREHKTIAREFPLLAQAASWTGGIANQNRGTLGGNIVNASPAADSLPALLVYDAELILVSVHGERRIRYRNFHTGYKKMILAEDELIRAVCLPRRFLDHMSYTRKVGTRSAQSIAKVAIAALGRLEEGKVRDARIALGSVAPTPIRLTATEAALNGNHLDSHLITIAKGSAASEIDPISDLRSTARYRAAIVGNLVAEFLEKLAQAEAQPDETLTHWNQLSIQEAAEEVLPCGGSRAWAHTMATRRPLGTQQMVLAVSDEIWRNLSQEDRKEAFRSHPRIGEALRHHPGGRPGQRSGNWSAEEQGGVTNNDEAVKQRIAALNAEYEKRFGHKFLVCASGKSAADIVEIMQRRLQNDLQTELVEMAEQQRQIIQIRLRKWLSGR